MSDNPKEKAGAQTIAGSVLRFRFSWKLLAALAVTAAAVILVGLYFYQAQEKAIRSRVQNEISSIAQLKAGEISRWRADRVAYANSITGRPFFSSTVNQFIQSPTAELESQLRRALTGDAALIGCDNIMVITVKGDIRFSLNKYPALLPQQLLGYLEEAFNSRSAVLTDFHMSPVTGKPHVDIVAPVFIKNGGAESPAGGLVLSIDPGLFLYRLIQSWPVPSGTAEILLVERQGESVLFLNELRFATDSAVKMRLPLTETGVIAVKAALGQTGFLEGIDYRGEEVLAAVERIEGSPWYMVAKMDRAEALSAWQLQSTMILAVFVTLLAALLAAIGLIWQRSRRQALETLYQSEKRRQALVSRYELLLKQASDIIVLTDAEMNIVEANDRALEAYGYTREEMLKLNAREIFSADSEVLRARLKELLEKGHLMTSGHHRRRDGSLMPVEFSIRLIEIEGAKYFQAIVRDVTGRKLAEQALRQSEEKFRRFFEMAPEYGFIVANDGSIMDVNNSTVTGLGYTREELINKPIFETVYNETSREKAWRLVEKWRKTGRLDDEEMVVLTKSGAEQMTLLSLAAVKDPNGKIMYSVALQRDITELRRLEEERQRADKLESVGTLAGGIAHDFNNVLTAILGNISLAGMMLRPGEEAIDILHEAERAALRAKNLTAQLLTFSRGGLPVMKIISLNSLLIETANFALRGSNVDCRFTIQPDLWQANVDEGQIGQVISNLVINARQAMPKGGTITITAENIVLTGRQSLGRTLPLDDGDYIRIMVADRGTGIPAEHLDRVFDPYFTTKQTGSGLGLAICYSIIRNHGGHISVESKTGEGTTFYVYLPATHEQAAADPKAAVQTQVPARSRLLIMDDEGSVCDIMGRLLDHLGYKDVAFAPDGHKAFELYRAALKTGRPFDAVILDFTVPGGMGGAETLQKLLEIDPGVRAIISSGYAGETVMAEYRQHGFRAALAKPFTLDELRQTLARVLGAD